ncbi:MAG: NAD(P)/FAD-dependent oxidoreductase [Planctomycetota bacterium]|jgi:flavin-dependent dehydrogenase
MRAEWAKSSVPAANEAVGVSAVDTGSGTSVHDAVVVGAGPAGASAALRLARAGLDTLLVERAEWPRDKVCGCCLHPSGVDELEALDASVGPDALGARRLARARIRARGRDLVVPTPGAVALSRTRLDTALVDAAIGAGVNFQQRTRAVLAPSVESSTRTLTLRRGAEESTVRTRIVLAADGLGGSLLAKGDQVHSRVEARARVGLGARLAADAVEIADDEVELHVAPHGYAGLVRLEDGSIDLAAAVDPESLARMGPEECIAAVFEAARSRLPAGLDSARWQGTASLSRRPPQAASRRAFALGDAAGYVEPFTGEGITWALVGGRLAAQAAIAEREGWEDAAMARWERDRDRELETRRRRCRAVSRAVRRPRLVSALAGPAARFEFFAAILGRVGYGPPRR